MHGRCNAVGLHHGANTKTSQAAEQCKQRAQPLPLAAQTILDGVHGAANPLAVVVFLAVLHCQHHFTVLGGHAKQCGHPHPEQGAGAAHGNRRGHAGNIARAHRGRQRRHQRGIGGDVAISLVAGAAAAPDHAKATHDIAQRHEAQSNLKIKARAENQHDHGNAPDNVVEGLEELG